MSEKRVRFLIVDNPEIPAAFFAFFIRINFLRATFGNFAFAMNRFKRIITAIFALCQRPRFRILLEFRTSKCQCDFVRTLRADVFPSNPGHRPSA